MAQLPAVNYLTDNARTEGEFKAGLEAMLAATKQIPGAGTADLAYTIAAGSITPAGGGGVLVVETESLAASDDLANVIITNYPDGSMLLLRNNNAARVVVVKHAATGSGQIFLDRNVDYVLDDTKKYLLIQRRGTDWYEVMRYPDRLSMPVVNRTASFTISKEDHGKVFQVTDTSTVSFLPAASLGNGFCVGIVYADPSGGFITLNPDASETVDGQAFLNLHHGQGVLLVCDGSNFFTVGNRNKPRMLQYAYNSSLSIDMSHASNAEIDLLTGNVTTLSVTGTGGDRIRIRFQQDATGGRTVASPAGSKINGSIDTTANKASYLDLYYSNYALRLEGFWSTVPV